MESVVEAGWHHVRGKMLTPSVSAQSMANVFRGMEAQRSTLGVVAYGLSMPTLEQVFLSVVGQDLQG